MSTKIYNGYKIAAQSLDDALVVLNSLKLDAKNVAISSILEEEILSALKIYDSIIFKKIFENKSFEEIEQNKKDEKVYKYKLENSALANSYSKKLNFYWNDKDKSEQADKSLQVVIYPQPVMIEGEKNYLLSLHADRVLEDWVMKKWKKLGIKEYGYWNNTDRPSKVTVKQWEKREEHWDEVLTGKEKTGIPSVEGLSMILTKVDQYFYDFTKNSYQEIRQKLIKSNSQSFSLEKRLKNYMHDFKANTIMKRLAGEQKSDNQEASFDVNDFMSRYYQANDVIRDESYLAEEAESFKKIEELLVQHLKKEVTLEDLSTPLSEVNKIFLDNFVVNNKKKLKMK